jgi:molecular chaperone GrpE
VTDQPTNGPVEEVGPDASGPTPAGPAQTPATAAADHAAAAPGGSAADAEVADAMDSSAATESGDSIAPEAAAEAPGAAPESDLAAERLADLQRLQAEYVNYKRRVDRDRAVVQERAVQSVLEALLPVLDDIHAAREHGDLADGPFAAIAEKLEGTLGKFGLERFGESGEAFDPMRHEALMHTAWPEDGSMPESADSTSVVQVLQPGYRAGETVIRAARVAVADPQ